jgi:hypothetical protein
VIGRALYRLLAPFVLISTLAPAPCFANIALSVQPLVAEFKVPPGSTGRLQVIVSNEGTDPERVLARRTDWRTIADGSITLEKVGAEHSHSITRDLSLSSYQFALQPGEHRQLTLSLSMPADAKRVAASYWGGFIINATDANAPPSALGVAATVFIYNNVDTPTRNVTVQSMRVLSGHDDNKLVVRFRNTGTSYVRPVAHLIIGQAGRVVHDQKITISTVFPGAVRIMTQQLGQLSPGAYRVELSIDYGGNSIIDAVTNANIR